MKTSFTLQEACTVLAIDETTLYRWLARSEMKPLQETADKRRRIISQAQLTALARSHHRPLPDEIQKHQASEIERLQVQIDALREEITALRREMLTLSGQRAPGYALPVSGTNKATSESGLPDGLIAWRTFADAHRIGQSTTQKAIATGRLAIVVGKWKAGKTFVLGALDAGGRARFYELYHENAHFTPCDSCPHAEVMD